MRLDFLCLCQDSFTTVLKLDFLFPFQVLYVSKDCSRSDKDTTLEKIFLQDQVRQEEGVDWERARLKVCTQNYSIVPVWWKEGLNLGSFGGWAAPLVSVQFWEDTSQQNTDIQQNAAILRGLLLKKESKRCSRILYFLFEESHRRTFPFDRPLAFLSPWGDTVGWYLGSVHWTARPRPLYSPENISWIICCWLVPLVSSGLKSPGCDTRDLSTVSCYPLN